MGRRDDGRGSVALDLTYVRIGYDRKLMRLRLMLTIVALASIMSSSLATGESLTLPTFGVSLEIPESWRRLPELDYTSAFRLSRTGSGSDGTTELSLFAVHADVLKSAKRESPKPSSVLEGREIWTTHSYREPGGRAAKLAYVFEDRGNVFALSSVAPDETRARAALTAVIAKLRFVEKSGRFDFAASTAVHPILRKSQIVFSPPDPLRAFPGAKGSLCFVSAGADMLKDRPDFVLTILKLEGISSTDDLKQSFVKWLQDRMDQKFSVTLKPIKPAGIEDLVVTTAPVQLPALRALKRVARFILIRNGQNEACIMAVEYQDGNDESANRLVDLLLPTIKVSPEQFEK